MARDQLEFTGKAVEPVRVVKARPTAALQMLDGFVQYRRWRELDHIMQQIVVTDRVCGYCFRLPDRGWKVLPLEPENPLLVST